MGYTGRRSKGSCRCKSKKASNEKAIFIKEKLTKFKYAKESSAKIVNKLCYLLVKKSIKWTGCRFGLPEGRFPFSNGRLNENDPDLWDYFIRPLRFVWPGPLGKGGTCVIGEMRQTFAFITQYD